MIKPLIKWVGGKTQILDKILDKIPNNISNYHEPFVGGGSVLLAVLSTKNISGDVYAYDINPILIQLYIHVRDIPNRLYRYIQELSEEYLNSTTMKDKEIIYYRLREHFNQEDDDSITKSALFIILNKLCFRGVYRESPKGFNVPFGHYKKDPVIVDKNHLKAVSKLIKNVNFICLGFNDSLRRVADDDFVYLDPPYAPENSNSFVGYNASGFSLQNHQDLFEMTKRLPNFLMSNSNVPLVLGSFETYNVEKITAKRAINSKNPASTTKEVLITNS